MTITVLKSMLVIKRIELNMKDMVRKTKEMSRMSTIWNQEVEPMPELPPRKRNVGRGA